MIVVKIELHSAVTREVTVIGRMVIINNGMGTDPSVGDYAVYLARKGTPDAHTTIHRPLRTGAVLNHKRLAYSVWKLIAKAIQSVNIHKMDIEEDK